MSASPSNPFVLPGFGQSGDAATNPLLASLEMMRQAFAGLAGPAGMSAGLGMSPPMNPEELERKIAELKSVENWLKLNLSMLSSTIQGMEVQLATIATLKSFMAAGSEGAANSQASGVQAAPPSWFSGWPSAAAQTPSSPQAYAQPEAQPPSQAEAQPQAEGADSPDGDTKASRAAQPKLGDAAAAAAPAAQAWWDMLQRQFGQVAAATAASMAANPAQAGNQAAAGSIKTAKKSTTNTTTKSATKTPKKTSTKIPTKTLTKTLTKTNAKRSS
jgi:hypothetical protein